MIGRKRTSMFIDEDDRASREIIHFLRTLGINLIIKKGSS